MQPVYVSELFRLLEFVGMDWQSVGKRLGAPRTPLSLWRHGRRPISRAYAGPLVRLTIDAVNQAMDKAKAQDAAEVAPKKARSILSGPSSRAAKLEVELWEFIGRWDRELYHTTGIIDGDTAKWLNVLSEYRQRDASKLDSFDLQRMWYAATITRRNAAELLRWRGEEATVETFQGFKSSGIYLPTAGQTPAERLAEMARAVRIEVEAGGDHEM